jgi:hypothetical protein
MGSRRSVGATGRGRRSAWAVEGRVVPLEEGEGLRGQ